MKFRKLTSSEKVMLGVALVILLAIALDWNGFKKRLSGGLDVWKKKWEQTK